MSINCNFKISSGSILSSGGGFDEEHKRIIERMLALGLTPTGNKASDKAKLREIEMQKVKTELGSKGNGTVNTGKYVTISFAEIEKLRETLKEKIKFQDNETNEKADKFKEMIGAEQQALLNKWLIKKQKR